MKNSKTYTFESKDYKEMMAALKEIKLICDIHRGPDNEVETPEKYFKNNLFYAIKHYVEAAEHRLFYVHEMKETVFVLSTARSELNGNTRLIMELFSLFNKPTSERFQKMFYDTDSNVKATK